MTIPVKMPKIAFVTVFIRKIFKIRKADAEHVSVATRFRTPTENPFTG